MIKSSLYRFKFLFIESIAYKCNIQDKNTKNYHYKKNHNDQ